MPTQAAPVELLSVSQVAQKIGIKTRQVIHLYERGFMMPAMRVGRVRAIPTTDLPKLKEAAKAAGYLKTSR